MKLRHRFLRLRLSMSKNARARYDKLEEQQQLAEITRKAQEHHEREAEVLEFVREKAETYHARKTGVMIDSGAARRIGDKVVLTRPPTAFETPRDIAMSGAIRVEEIDLPEDQFRNMLRERHSLINKARIRDYKERTKNPEPPKITTIDPRDALHFMTTGKIPVRTRAELKEIVDMGDAVVEEVEVSDDAAAMLYLSNRNHRD